MTVEQFEIGPAILLDDNAKNKLHSLIVDEGNPEVKLRVFVTGGGCSGFQYGFAFEDDAHDEDDIVINHDGITLVVDYLSIQYLTGSTIKFKDDVIGSRFTIENPNATTTCGCGSSFSV